MRKSNVIAAIISLLTLFSCSQVKTAIDSGTSFNIDRHDYQIGDKFSLPGADRSAFEGDLAPLAIPLLCKIEDSGPYTREQPPIVVGEKYNYIEGIFSMPMAAKSDFYRPHMYIGGDTKIGNALDAGVQYVPGTNTWQPFLRLEQYKNVNDGYQKWENSDPYKSYQLVPGNRYAFKLYVYKLSNKNRLKYIITPDYSTQNNTIKVYKITYKVVNGVTVVDTVTDSGSTVSSVSFDIPVSDNTWNSEGNNQIFKLMNTVAAVNKYQFSDNIEYVFKSGEWFNIRYGIRDTNGRLTLKPWNPTICIAPPDMVIKGVNHSSIISIRELSKLKIESQKYTFKINSTYTVKFRITNTGSPNSTLYYDYKNQSGVRQSGKLKGSEFAEGQLTGACDKPHIDLPVSIFYSPNETLQLGQSQPSGFSIDPYTINNPLGNIDLSQPGSLKFVLQNHTISIDCTKQSFSMSAVPLTTTVNTPVNKIADLKVATPDGSPITGSFQISTVIPAAAQAGRISAQRVYFEPASDISYNPPSGTNQATQNVTVTGQCPETPGTYNVTAKVTDPTGNTDPIEVPVVLTCVANPKISDPTPNPLNISATVWQTASGTFSFSNVGDPGSTLTYTLSPSSGLSVNPTSGSLAKDSSPTATIAASYTCTTPGIVAPAPTVVISSNDPDRPNVTETVNVECKDGQPKIDDPTLSDSSAEIYQVATSTLHFSNIGGGSLKFSLTSEDGLNIDPLNGSLAAGQSADIPVKYTCTDTAIHSIHVVVHSNDPDPSRQALTTTASVTCTPAQGSLALVSTSQLTFNAVWYGSLAVKTFAVTNVGTGRVSIQIMEGLPTYYPSSEYQWYQGFNDNSGGYFELLPGESRVVRVEYGCRNNYNSIPTILETPISEDRDLEIYGKYGTTVLNAVNSGGNMFIISRKGYCSPK